MTTEQLNYITKQYINKVKAIACATSDEKIKAMIKEIENNPEELIKWSDLPIVLKVLKEEFENRSNRK